MTTVDSSAEPRLVIDVVTLFPEAIESFLRAGIMGRAIAQNLVQVVCTNPRDFATDTHRTVDDAPFGGGPGMVMKIEPVVAALDAIARSRGRGHRVMLSPSGVPFDQARASTLAQAQHLVLLCGRYEGIDDRVRTHFADECISLGDFVLNGGEVASLAVIEAVARLVEGVVQNPESVARESFATADAAALEHPQYTRPATFRDHPVPSVLASGDHRRIARWRRGVSLLRTMRLRPDLVPPSRAAARALKVFVVVDARAYTPEEIATLPWNALLTLPVDGLAVCTEHHRDLPSGARGVGVGARALANFRRRLRQGTRSVLMPIPVCIDGRATEGLPGGLEGVLRDDDELARVLTGSADLGDEGHASTPQGDGAGVQAHHPNGVICAILVLGDADRTLCAQLRGADPPVDFCIGPREMPEEEKTPQSGVATGDRLIKPAHPQTSPPETVIGQAAHLLARFFAGGSNDSQHNEPSLP